MFLLCLAHDIFFQTEKLNKQTIVTGRRTQRTLLIMVTGQDDFSLPVSLRDAGS